MEVKRITFSRNERKKKKAREKKCLCSGGGGDSGLVVPLFSCSGSGVVIGI